MRVYVCVNFFYVSRGIPSKLQRDHSVQPYVTGIWLDPSAKSQENENTLLGIKKRGETY